MMKKIMLSAVLTLLLSVTTTLATAGGLELSLSNDTANLVVHLDPEQVYNRAGGSDISVGVFTNEIGEISISMSQLARWPLAFRHHCWWRHRNLILLTLLSKASSRRASAVLLMRRNSLKLVQDCRLKSYRLLTPTWGIVA